MVETQGTTTETSDVLRIFPTFVWKAEVTPGVGLGIEDDVLGTLDEMRGAAAQPALGRLSGNQSRVARQTSESAIRQC